MCVCACVYYASCCPVKYLTCSLANRHDGRSG
jgi:hypothetical protein|eukprot:SAG25_NODE_543_length_7045_cov_4.651166_4_plen_32_part_00